jgi:hypothetical protein
MEQAVGDFLSQYPWILIVAMLWSLPWKGWALWKAARNKQEWWFIIFLLVNTLGILEMLYIFVLSKENRITNGLKKTGKGRKIFIAFFVVAVFLLIISAIRAFSDEDNWLCQNGEWVRHGNPSVPKPSDVCPGSTDQKTMRLKLFFGNSKLDPEFTCVKVFPVTREAAKTAAPARRALELLFEGPNSEDRSAGYFTSLNQGVAIKSLSIKDGIAYVDFDKKLEEAVGGSCRVVAISAQIKETLKQFDAVKDVVISVEGRTEDILQP